MGTGHTQVLGGGSAARGLAEGDGVLVVLAPPGDAVVDDAADAHAAPGDGRAVGATLDGVSFAPPAIPVVANATARPYEPASVRETLGRQIGSSVRWLDSMLFLMDAGVEAFEEVGPGSVLRKLVAQIRKKRAG